MSYSNEKGHDYEWKWYMKDLKAGKIQSVMVTGEERAGAGYLAERLPAPERKKVQRAILDMLTGYREQDPKDRELIEEVMKLHGAYCKAGNDLAKRHHNAAVCKYMLKTPMNDRSVAFRLHVNERTVKTDIIRAIDELAVILIGVPALPDAPTNWQGAVLSTLKNMRLLELGCEVSRRFPSQEMEQERIRGQEHTACSIRSMKKAFSAYEVYSGRYLANRGETEERALKTVRSLFLDKEMKSIQTVAEETGISIDTVYDDMNRVVRHFAELLEYMAIIGAGPKGKESEREKMNKMNHVTAREVIDI